MGQYQMPERIVTRVAATLAIAVPLTILAIPIAFAAPDEEARIEAARARTYAPLDLSLFSDSIHHWHMKDGRGRDDARYHPAQIVQIAENLLLFQNRDGGWPANLDWLSQLTYEEIYAMRGSPLQRSTFDNRNTYPQIDYLARVFSVTGLERYRQAAERGLDYVVQEQRPTGGWCGKDVDAITYNDDVMVGIMNLLLTIQEEAPQFEWLDRERHASLQRALEKAVDVTLKCQIRVGGRRTAWCQQHDHETFEPVKARTYELPSITAQESVGVVRFLMRLPTPSEDVRDAIESAVTWFETAKIEGIRVKTISIEPVRFKQHTAKIDRIVIPDEQAPPVWARFYEVETNRPFFCNRDGIVVYRLSDVHLERRSGYAWYGGWPTRLLSETYPAWKKRLSEKCSGTPITAAQGYSISKNNFRLENAERPDFAGNSCALKERTFERRSRIQHLQRLVTSRRRNVFIYTSTSISLSTRSLPFSLAT